jgi:hypothetical protein
LAPVHRRVGVPQKLVRFGPRLCGRNSERAADPLRSAREWERVGEDRQDPIGNVHAQVTGVDTFDDEGEFVASQSRDGVRSPHRLLQCGCDQAQKLVARPMAQAVVDELEVVQVEKHHRDPAVAPAAARQRLAETIQEEQSIRQTGERVVERLVDELSLQPLPLRGVSGDPLQPDRLTVVEDKMTGDLDRDLIAALGDDSHLDDLVSAAGELPGQDPPYQRSVTGRDQVEEVHRQQFRAAEARQPLRRLVHGGEVSGRVRDVDGIESVLEHAPVALFAQPAGGQVEEDANPADECPPPIENRGGGPLHPHDGAIRVLKPIFQGEVLAGLRRPPPLRGHSFRVRMMEGRRPAEAEHLLSGEAGQ